MTAVTNHRIRFCENNIALSQYLTNTPSFTTGYSYLNVFDVNRSKKWISNNNFSIDSTNNKIYINDGSDKTITLTTANYTGTTLASHIQTQLNASSSGWTVTYNTSTYLFTISRGSSATLRFSVTTSSTWNDLGYLFTTNQNGTSFVSHSPRIHNYEFFNFDFGVPRPIDFIALISPVDESFGISSYATIELRGSNFALFNSPAVTITVPIFESGAFKFEDNQFSAYRYWQLRIKDQMNTTGVISFSHLFLGDYETISQSNVSIGIEQIENDLTVQSPAESGKLYFDEGNKYSQFNNLSISAMSLSDKDKLLRLWRKLGRSTPFYISIDPTTCTSTELGDLTKFCYFTDQPIFTHLIFNLWSLGFSVREVI